MWITFNKKSPNKSAIMRINQGVYCIIFCASKMYARIFHYSVLPCGLVACRRIRGSLLLVHLSCEDSGHLMPCEVSFYLLGDSSRNGARPHSSHDGTLSVADMNKGSLSFAGHGAPSNILCSISVATLVFGDIFS